jgi:glyoxylase-like metal-dependent hydrolase (beta-lactamase superfamily II)
VLDFRLEGLSRTVAKTAPTMKLGPFDISVYNHGYFRLDGGAMFGTVPRTIWSKLAPPDEENRILLAARSLVIREGERVFMIDAGMGDRWTEKLRRIYDIQLPVEAEGGLDPESVTDIILTHLHFDHARGIFRARPGTENEVDLRFPNARVYLQAANYENAKSPNARERASYIAEDVKLLERTRLVLTSGSQELYPGIWVHGTNGHTRGHQWIEVKGDGLSLAFPADMVPTSRHLPLPYLMGYDISAETLLQEKDGLLDQAVAERWILVFGHDPDVPAGWITRDEKGHYSLEEAIALS